MENWYKLSEASLKLNKSEVTLRRYIKQNKIPFKLEGGKYFVKVDEPEFELEAIKNEQRSTVSKKSNPSEILQLKRYLLDCQMLIEFLEKRVKE